MPGSAGYPGSARTLRRAVAEAKAEHRRQRRVYRPWQPTPGEHLVIDWGEEDGRKVFCAVLAWSRFRFVRFAADERQATSDVTRMLLASERLQRPRSPTCRQDSGWPEL